MPPCDVLVRLNAHFTTICKQQGGAAALAKAATAARGRAGEEGGGGGAAPGKRRLCRRQGSAWFPSTLDLAVDCKYLYPCDTPGKVPGREKR
jgi:hypothetical protein